MESGRMRLFLFIMSLALVAAWSLPRVGGARSADLDLEEEAEEGEEESEFPEDQGPNKIDVSEYPKEQQKNYKLFSSKCSKCHTLARPINSKFVTPKEWTAYVKLMGKKRRSGVRKKDIPKITSFLIFDSAIRKKELLKEKLEKEQQEDSEGAEQSKDAEE